MNPEAVNTEVAVEKVDTNLTQQQPDPNLTQNQSETQSQTEPQANEDPNWRAFREARKKDRAEKEAAEKRAIEKEAEVAALKAAMEAAFSKQSPHQPQSNSYQSYPQEETEDERIEKKVQAAIAARDAQVERMRQEEEQKSYPDRLVKNHPDFNAVVSTENMDYLDYHHPEITRPLKRLNDGYDKWSDIYAAIKKYVPNSTTAKREAAKIDMNYSKPKSMSTPGMAQTLQGTTSTKLSEEKKAENWARMQQRLKSVG